MNAEQVRDVIASVRYRYRDETQLQESIAFVLHERGVDAGREVRLNARDRIDFLVDRVGVEVKVASRAPAVLRQLRRYAASDRIDELLLITNRVRHRLLPAEIDGKPLTVLALTGLA